MHFFRRNPEGYQSLESLESKRAKLEKEKEQLLKKVDPLNSKIAEHQTHLDEIQAEIQRITNLYQFDPAYKEQYDREAPAIRAIGGLTPKQALEKEKKSHTNEMATLEKVREPLLEKLNKINDDLAEINSEIQSVSNNNNNNNARGDGAPGPSSGSKSKPKQ